LLFLHLFPAFLHFALLPPLLPFSFIVEITLPPLFFQSLHLLYWPNASALATLPTLFYVKSYQESKEGS
jgi:hypothetical protein